MTPELVAAFGQYGPLGLMIGYLVWEKRGERELRRELALARATADIERAESDRALATSLSALTVTIQHFGMVAK